MPYCFDVKFRTARPIGADKLEEVFKPRAFKRPLLQARWDEQARGMAGGRVVRLCRLCRSKSQWCAASRGAADHRCTYAER